MANADQLCDSLQASRLFDELRMSANMHGFSIGRDVTWHVGSIVLPEAVRRRSEIEDEQAEGYSFVAVAPKLVEDEAVRELFGDRKSDILTATINLRQRSDVGTHSPNPDMQYRLKQSTASGLTEIDKFYLGGSVDFGILDEEEKAQLRQSQTVKLFDELSDLPDDVIDIDDSGIQRILGAIGGILGRESDEKLANRENADQLARALGLTAVYSDEIESLLEFLKALFVEASLS